MPKSLPNSLRFCAALILMLALTILVFSILFFYKTYSFSFITISALTILTTILCFISTCVKNVDRAGSMLIIVAVLMFVMVGLYIVAGAIALGLSSSYLTSDSKSFFYFLGAYIPILILLVATGIIALKLRKEMILLK